LLDIPFDIYQRYKVVSDIICKFRNSSQKYKILDVGAGFEETLKKFLPEDQIFNLDREYPPEYSQKENYIVGDITKIELNESYDFVVSIDVFEHIPPLEREKFLDVLISSSTIATIIAAPFDQENVKSCEFLANELYKLNHGHDYIWLKEHIENGLPSLSVTIDLIKKHNLNTLIIPNGYLPRWFQMISLYLLTEGKSGFFPMMEVLNDIYNQNYYPWDNRNPAYRQVIIIPKNNVDIDFSDLLSKKSNSECIPDNSLLLESFIEKNKRSYQIGDNGYFQKTGIQNQQDADKEALEQTLNQATKTIESQSIQIATLNQALTDKEQHFLVLSNQIFALNQTLFEKEQQFKVLSNQIATLDLALADKEQQFLILSNQIAALNQALDDKEQQLLVLSNQIAALNQALDDKEQQSQQSNQQIKSLKEQGSIQKEQIEKLNKKYNDVIIHAQGLEQVRSQQTIQINTLTNQVEQITRHAQGLEQVRSQQAVQINALSGENISLKSSVCYQFTSKFHHTIIERIFPQNTRRRNYYDLGLKGIRILVTEGFGKLRWHFNERRRVKRIERDIQNKEKKEDIRAAVKDFTESSIARVKLPEPEEIIEVSIIIPVHNQFQFTNNCLHSISKNTKGNYEVIVVDDASTDETVSQLKDIENLKLICNNENLGFIESCNKGARLSNGKYILFLNNDTLVTDDWLTPLLDLIKKDDVGAVGSKLVYPDGKLQEAGAIIWNDASGWNYGRGDKPEKPEYNFVRDVDYCSGAALMVKRELLEKYGGFDSQFKPAYYEDADLCFSIRQMGYKVRYQPKSVVIHFEGISSGTSLTEGVKQNQVNNKEKFLHKWENVLQESHFGPDPGNLLCARSRSHGKKILVIDQYIPFFDRDAGSYRMFNILKILSELGHNVSFIGDNFHPFEPYTSIMQQSGIEVIFSPHIISIEQYLSKFGDVFNIVIVSRPYIAQKHMADIRKYCIHAKVIYDTVDLAFLRESRMADVKKDPQLLEKANEMKNIELELARMSDITLVVSTKEQQILKEEDPSLNVQVISLIHKIILPSKKFPERRDLLFLGAFLHTPNADGALWFIREIFPKIKKQDPALRIFIVGDRPTEEILSLASDDIIITGYVEDISVYFTNCRVFVAPLRFGAGVKGKINQSMSRGLPVVTTSIGAEGMGTIEGETVLIADDPDVFAQKVIQLYNDEKLWNTISINSIEHIRKNTSYEQSKIRIKHFIDSLDID